MIVKYTNIESIGKDYVLSALLEEDGSYCMPSLKIDDLEFWDNDFFLYNLLTVLKLWEKRQLIDSNILFLKNDVKEIPEEDYEYILELLEEGDKLGFFNKTK